MLETFLTSNYTLTTRELEVLKLVLEGYNNNEIANLLNISTHTAKAHVSSLLKKIGESSRIKMAIKVVKELLKNNIEI